MKLINDTANPQLLGIVETDQDIIDTQKMVNALNRDLVDSGFDKYQYQAVRRGNKLYIEQRGA
jgi:hypothetical protein